MIFDAASRRRFKIQKRKKDSSLKSIRDLSFKISLVRDENLRPMVDALGPESDEGRGVPAISLG